MSAQVNNSQRPTDVLDGRESSPFQSQPALYQPYSPQTTPDLRTFRSYNRHATSTTSNSQSCMQSTQRGVGLGITNSTISDFNTPPTTPSLQTTTWGMSENIPSLSFQHTNARHGSVILHHRSRVQATGFPLASSSPRPRSYITPPTPPSMNTTFPSPVEIFSAKPPFSSENGDNNFVQSLFASSPWASAGSAVRSISSSSISSLAFTGPNFQTPTLSCQNGCIGARISRSSLHIRGGTISSTSEAIPSLGIPSVSTVRRTCSCPTVLALLHQSDIGNISMEEPPKTHLDNSLVTELQREDREELAAGEPGDGLAHDGAFLHQPEPEIEKVTSGNKVKVFEDFMDEGGIEGTTDFQVVGGVGFVPFDEEDEYHSDNHSDSDSDDEYDHEYHEDYEEYEEEEEEEEMDNEVEPSTPPRHIQEDYDTDGEGNSTCGHQTALTSLTGQVGMDRTRSTSRIHLPHSRTPSAGVGRLVIQLDTNTRNARQPLAEIGIAMLDTFMDENDENDSGLWMAGSFGGEGGDYEGGGREVFDDPPFY